MKLCPRCRGRLVPIVYGMPAADLVEKAIRGELSIGGCVVIDDPPDRVCSKCGLEWRTHPGSLLLQARQ